MLKQTVEQLVKPERSEHRTRIPGTSFHSSLRPNPPLANLASTDMTRELVDDPNPTGTDRNPATTDSGCWR